MTTIILEQGGITHRAPAIHPDEVYTVDHILLVDDVPVATLVCYVEFGEATWQWETIDGEVLCWMSDPRGFFEYVAYVLKCVTRHEVAA